MVVTKKTVLFATCACISAEGRPGIFDVLYLSGISGKSFDFPFLLMVHSPFFFLLFFLSRKRSDIFHEELGIHFSFTDFGQFQGHSGLGKDETESCV